MFAVSFDNLLKYLRKVPSIVESINFGLEKDFWWVKFQIDIEDPLAWNIVQEFAHVLNYLSIEDRLPTTFMPVSPPPYLNGGPREFLSWVIGVKSNQFTPDDIKDWLKSRLPNPVNRPKNWQV